MTCVEFNNEFDIYYNSITSNQAPSLDIYEKSVILTLAQEDLVREYYSGTNNSFEYTEEVRRALDELVKFITVTPSKESSPLGGTQYELPKDLWFITYENVKIVDPTNECLNNTELSVVPTTQDEYNRVKNNPFKGANKRQALRLDIGKSKVSLISKYPLGQYTIGYISELEPIILDDITGLTINGLSNKNECKLNSATHRIILNKAVEIARAVYVRNTQQ